MASVAACQRMVDAELGIVTMTAPTTPMRLQPTSAAGTTSAAGSTTNMPAAQNIAFNATNTSGQAIGPTGALSFTNTSGSTQTVTGVNITDQGARFSGYGNLTGGNKTLNNNDILSFAVNSVTYAVTPA